MHTEQLTLYKHAPSAGLDVQDDETLAQQAGPSLHRGFATQSEVTVERGMGSFGAVVQRHDHDGSRRGS